MLASGVSRNNLAVSVGISVSAVDHILKGRTWGWLV